MRMREPARGASAVEALLALPVILLAGLGAWQAALVMQARANLAWAANEAVRAGSVARAEPAAIELGLARGLVPWLYGPSAADAPARRVPDARAHLAAGTAGGWIRLRQLAPTDASFADWAEPALDALGRPIDGLLEIPIDNRVARRRRQSPASGTAGTRAGAPIGAVSGQTLDDATLLKIEVTYGVPLVVPLVGRLAAEAMRFIGGCDGGVQARRLGAIEARVTAVPSSGTWCPFYQGTDERGRSAPRWPVRVGAIVRMQSPVRRSAWTPAVEAARPLRAERSGTEGAFGDAAGRDAGDGAQADAQPVDVAGTSPEDAGPPAAAATVAEAPTASAAADDVGNRSPGFLRFGSPHARPPPGVCPG